MYDKSMEHCSAQDAGFILFAHAEDAWFFINDNADIYNDFCNSQIEHDWSISEYIWNTHWADFCRFIHSRSGEGPTIL